MIRVSSNHLKHSELQLIKRYSTFILYKLLNRKSTLRKSLIDIKICQRNELLDEEDIHDLKRYGAWCVYKGIENNKKKFTVIVNAHNIKKAKDPLKKMKQIMIDLAHELVHVKQYLNNEMFDYVSGDVRYKGDYFDSRWQKDEEAYYNSPWEIEAYGREWGLYKMFCTKLKEECKK